MYYLEAKKKKIKQGKQFKSSIGTIKDCNIFGKKKAEYEPDIEDVEISILAVNRKTHRLDVGTLKVESKIFRVRGKISQHV